jgi:transcription elongation GreA/GreB family factor
MSAAAEHYSSSRMGAKLGTPTTVWISDHAYRCLQEELNDLKMLLDGHSAETSGDDENFHAIQRARQARVQQIHELLIHAVVGEDPPDDGVAEPGMVVTVRYEDTDEVETFLLGIRGTKNGELETYSIESPLGQAILGCRPRDRRSYLTPAGSAATVTVLSAVPYGLHRKRDCTPAEYPTVLL